MIYLVFDAYEEGPEKLPGVGLIKTRVATPFYGAALCGTVIRVKTGSEKDDIRGIEYGYVDAAKRAMSYLEDQLEKMEGEGVIDITHRFLDDD